MSDTKFPRNSFLEQLIDFNNFLNEILEKKLVKLVEYSYDVHICPTCKTYIENGKGIYLYCPYCGQRITWGRVKNNVTKYRESKD